MNRPKLAFCLIACTLLCSCLSQQLSNHVAYVKHTKPLQALFWPTPTKYPHIIDSWVHKGSKYTIRAKKQQAVYNWLIEVEHPNGDRFCHRCPEPPFSKALRKPTASTPSVLHHHKGERLTLTLKHLNNARVSLHAHNLGVISPNQQPDSAATATLTHAIQQGGHISLRYCNGKEYQLTEWEQEALRRILHGAIATPQQPNYCSLRLHSPDGTLLYELALGEYWPYNGGPHGPGIPTMQGAILAGDFQRFYLHSWWSAVCCRLELPAEPNLPSAKTSRCGPGVIDGTTLDILMKKP